MFPDIDVRVTKEMTALAPASIKVKIVAPPREEVQCLDWRQYFEFIEYVPRNVDQ